MATNIKLKIGAVLFPGFELLDIHGLLEMLAGSKTVSFSHPPEFLQAWI